MRPALQLAPLMGVVFELLTGCVFARAQNSLTNAPLTLTAAVRFAVRDNAELASLRARQDAMRERPARVRGLPNPVFTYSGMDAVNGGAWPDTGEKRFMVQQEFPWFGKRALREGIAVKDAEALQREIESLTQEVVMMVKEVCFDLNAVQQVMVITVEEQAVVRCGISRWTQFLI